MEDFENITQKQLEEVRLCLREQVELLMSYIERIQERITRIENFIGNLALIGDKYGAGR